MNEVMTRPETIIQSAPVNAFEMRPRTLDEAMKFCEIMADSDLVPSGYKGKPGNIMVAIQMGQELGMTPMRALRCIAVINGRPSMWGDELLAMVLASPVCEYVNETDSTDKEGICKVRRKGGHEHVSRFALEDAKRAGLLNKQGPWQANTSRMLKLRARGFALRDVFADVLAGLVTAEEAMDIPAPVPIEVQVEAPRSLKDRLKEKVGETKPESQAARETGSQEPVKMASPQASDSDSGPNHPTLVPANVAQQFRLCESIAEWSQIANGWQEESHLHSDEERAQVKTAADAAKKRLGKK